MLKKIITIILFVLVAGVSGFFIIRLNSMYKNEKAQVEMLTGNNANIQAQLDAIGNMAIAYQLNVDKKSGDEILESDLVEVDIPEKAISGSIITDKSSVVGKAYKIDTTAGTIMTSDLVSESSDVAKGSITYNKEIQVAALPVTTQVGDFVDIRFLIANGEEYVVLNKKQIKYMNENTISIEVSEEENAILNALFQDLAIYPTNCVAYLTKYLEPGNQESIAFYPVQHAVEPFIMFNPNIVDRSRCINSELRDHIDQSLTLTSKTENASISSAFISAIQTQLSGTASLQASWQSGEVNEAPTASDGSADIETYAEEGEVSGEEVSEVIEGETTDTTETTETTEEVDTEAIE